MLTNSIFHRYLHTKLQGLLTMHPAAENKFGMDACSLLCLHSNPPVLVVVLSQVSYVVEKFGDNFFYHFFGSYRYFHTRLQGPLTMHPAAEDNYGMDACSLLCLHSNPPVLVVATSSSVLHHCVVLMSQDAVDVDVSGSMGQ